MLAIIFLLLYPILGIFSKDFRELSKKAFACAFKRITLKPCDVDFGKEVKDKLLSKLIFKYPNLARFIDKTASLWALIFVVVNILGLAYLFNGALNLFVYDTCYPTTGQSCSLAGEACSIDSDKTPTLLETINRIPDRLKTWDAKEYLPTNPTYYYPYDQNKKTAIEIIDPLCISCLNLLKNIKEAKFEEKYNLTYIAYPIPDGEGYKFKHSYLISSILEALKKYPLPDKKTTTDWLLLNSIFTESINGIKIQEYINISYTKEEVEKYISTKLLEYGYSQEEINTIFEYSKSDEIKDILEKNSNIVENKVKTYKIPTIIFNGKRYDRVIPTENLK